jgi:hypothetical protein
MKLCDRCGNKIEGNNGVRFEMEDEFKTATLDLCNSCWTKFWNWFNEMPHPFQTKSKDGFILWKDI